MAVFDQVITPVSSTPANTSLATLFTASADTSVLIDIANLTTTGVAIRVGVIPSGGSIHYKLYDVPIPAGDALIRGPWFLQNGDAIQVRTATADVITFSLTGIRST